MIEAHADDLGKNEGSQFAWRAVTLFAIGIGSVIALNICEQQNVIDRQTEGFLRLIINVGIVSGLCAMTLRSNLSARLQFLIFLIIITSTAETTLGFTEDVAAWNQIPIIGKNSQVRPLIEAVLPACWMIGGFALIYVAIFAMERSRRTLNQRNRRLESALESLKDAQQQLVQRERLSAFGEMASGVAHDLNNTLSPVVAYSELLLRSPNLNDEQRNWLECVHEGALDMASTVKGLNRFYEQSTAMRKPTDLRKLIEQVVELTRPRWRDETQRYGNQISIELELKDCSEVQCDPREIRMVLTNLIFNSIDALPRGGNISIRLIEEGNEVVMSVSDNGVGMSADQVARCFQPFVSWKERGSGLGLSVCHGIITNQGGSVSVVSKLGEGATFIAKFPASLSVQQDDLRITERSATGQRILVIDDDHIVRNSMVAMLEVLGAEVLSAGSGSEALELFAGSNEFELVITDLGMAGMDGAEIVRSIRNMHPQQRIAVISGWSEEEVRRRFGSRSYPDRVLQKPATVDDLEQLICEFPRRVHSSSNSGSGPRT